MAINDLTYNRYNNTQGIIQNRLYSVNDNVDENDFTDDIDDQGTFNNTLNNVNIANNYAYDELGNLTKNTQKEIAEIKWTVYGKVQEVIRTNGSSKKNLKFEYNATGQRTAKHVYSSSDVFEHSDYYVYDASGNLMSVYRKFSDANEQVLSYSLTERPMYGSSRLGVDKTTIEFIGYTPPTNGLTSHVVGLKQYEGSNHLGNILTTFSDKKMPVDANSDGIIDYSTANITSSTDYYPFGVTMKGRDFTSNVSRFGFNGKEKDEETETMDFGARLLDGDLGLWLACDPLAAKYPSLSLYNYCNNNPIIFYDEDGNDFYAYTKRSQRQALKTMRKTFGKNHGFYFLDNKLCQSPNKYTGNYNQVVAYNLFCDLVVNNHNNTVIFQGFNAEKVTLIIEEREVPEGNAKTISIEDNGIILSAFAIGKYIEFSLFESRDYPDPNHEYEKVKTNKYAAFWHEIGHPMSKMFYKNINSTTEQLHKWTIGFENLIRPLFNLQLRSGSLHEYKGADNDSFHYIDSEIPSPEKSKEPTHSIDSEIPSPEKSNESTIKT